MSFENLVDMYLIRQKYSTYLNIYFLLFFYKIPAFYQGYISTIKIYGKYTQIQSKKFELFVTHSFTNFSLTKTEAGVQQSIGRRPQKAPTARDSDAECKSSGLFFYSWPFFLLTVPTNRGLH